MTQRTSILLDLIHTVAGGVVVANLIQGPLWLHITGGVVTAYLLSSWFFAAIPNMARTVTVRGQSEPDPEQADPEQVDPDDLLSGGLRKRRALGFLPHSRRRNPSPEPEPEPPAVIQGTGND